LGSEYVSEKHSDAPAHEDFFSCKSPLRRQNREKIASLIRELRSGSKGSELEDSLQRCRAAVCKLLSEVRATVGATERLTIRYFPGLKIVFKTDANALEELSSNAIDVAEYYNVLVDDFAANENEMGTGKAGRFERIDIDACHSASEETAVTVYKNLLRLAHAEMLWFLNDRRPAAEVLRPIVSGDEDESNEPPS
jgi:hypothetical protein